MVSSEFNNYFAKGGAKLWYIIKPNKVGEIENKIKSAV